MTQFTLAEPFKVAIKSPFLISETSFEDPLANLTIELAEMHPHPVSPAQLTD